MNEEAIQELLKEWEDAVGYDDRKDIFMRMANIAHKAIERLEEVSQ